MPDKTTSTIQIFNEVRSAEEPPHRVFGFDPAHKEGDRSVINGHVLYKASDFADEEPSLYNTTKSMVVEGDLCVCMRCGEFEAGLFSSCKGEKHG